MLLGIHCIIMCCFAWQQYLGLITGFDILKFCFHSSSMGFIGSQAQHAMAYSSNINIYIYPIHGANLTLIQPMWSAYTFAPTSLYGIHMPLLPYLVIQSIVLGIALLWAAIDSALSQGPLLWRHSDMTVIVSRNTRGRERDTRQRLDNANALRLQTVNRYILCRIQCDLFHISAK